MRAGISIVGCLILVVAVMAASIVPVSASSRTSGEFWTYASFMPVSGTNASGFVTYRFLDTTDLTLGGARYIVDVMKVTGNLSGSSNPLGMHFIANSSISGTSYSSDEGMTLAKEDLFFFTNTSLASGPFALANHIQREVTTTYIPPYLSLFSPSKSKPGDTWSEELTVNTTTTEYDNGTFGGRSTDIQDITVTVDIASALEKVTTEAGVFDALKVTVSRSDGNLAIYWWSSAVGNIVMQREYSSGGAEPIVGMTLTDFESKTAETLVVVIVGIAVLIIAVIVIAAVLTTRKRSGLPGEFKGGTQPGVGAGPQTPPTKGPKGK